jgi:hypothetical protein
MRLSDYLDDKRRPRSMPKKGLFAKGASGEAGSRQSHFQAADGGPPANRPFRDARDGSRPVNFVSGVWLRQLPHRAISPSSEVSDKAETLRN